MIACIGIAALSAGCKRRSAAGTKNDESCTQVQRDELAALQAQPSASLEGDAASDTPMSDTDIQSRLSVLQATCGVAVAGVSPEGWERLTGVVNDQTFQQQLKIFMEQDPQSKVLADDATTPSNPGLALDDEGVFGQANGTQQTQAPLLRNNRGVSSWRSNRVAVSEQNVALALQVTLAGMSASTSRQISFTARYAATALIEAENNAQAVFTRTTSAPDYTDPRSAGGDTTIVNMQDREWVRYTCLLSVDLSIADAASLSVGASAGADVWGASVRLSTSGTTSENAINQQIFTREMPWILRRSSESGELFVSAIQNTCRQFADRMRQDPGLQSDMAYRTSSWQYTNRLTTCLAESDCESWYRDLLPSVRNWTVPRCVVGRVTRNGESGTARSCVLRSIRQGSCTPAGERHVPFSYPCDDNMSCQNRSSGIWVFRQSAGRCQ